MRKSGKIWLGSFLVLVVMTLVAGVIGGVKYYRVRNSGAQVEVVSGPERSGPAAPLRLGEKFAFRVCFRAPWGVRPAALTVEPAEGSQLTAPPKIAFLKAGWGANLWQGVIPLQVFREGEIAAAKARALFSNRQTLALTLPAVKIIPPEIKGNQLELAGELASAESGRRMARRGLWWLFALAAALLASLAVWAAARRIRKKTPPAPLWEQALSAIQTLLEQVKSGNAAPASSLARLTDIVRDYLERRFTLRVTRQTTGEFLADLERGRGGLEMRHREFLRGFLMASDLVKFARAPADCGRFADAADQAATLIRETIPELEHSKE